MMDKHMLLPAFFNGLRADWQLPKEGTLCRGPSGVFTITSARSSASFNDVRSNLGAVEWWIEVLEPGGGVFTGTPVGALAKGCKWIIT